MNNLYYYTTVLIGRYGHQTTLLLIGLFLAATTFVKTLLLLPLVGGHGASAHRHRP